MLETEFPHINTLGFVSHNFKRPSSVQDKDFWLLLGPRLEGSSPVCQWVGICPVARMSLKVAHLPCWFLVCWQCSEQLLSQSFGDWGIFRSGIGLHITSCGRLTYSHCEFWMRLPKFWIVNNPSDKAVWNCSHYFFPLFIWLLRSPVTDTTSWVIILACAYKVAKGISFHGVTLPGCMILLISSASWANFNHLPTMVFIYAASQPNIHLNSCLPACWDPKMQIWLSDGSPVLRKL